MGEIAEALQKARAEQSVRSAERHSNCDPEEKFDSPPVLPGSTAVEPARRDHAAAREENQPEQDGPDLKCVLPHLERYRHLALRVRGALEARKASAVVIVSALRNEGKTTISCNLAAAMASLTPDREVALVDLDLRNPSVLRRLQIDQSAGVEAFLRGEVDFDSLRYTCTNPALDLYGTCVAQTEAHQLLAGPRLIELIERLKQRYRAIFVDTPPCLLVPDASLIMRELQACIPVAMAQHTRVHHFEEMLTMLPAETVIGKILNDRHAPRKDRDYYAYYDAENDAENDAEGCDDEIAEDECEAAVREDTSA